MRFIVAIGVLYLVGIAHCKSTKKSVLKDESFVLNKKLIGKSKPASPPAIIAIEIVDPNENTTSSKNSKRTIDSNLGYGYRGLYGAASSPPRYEVYKYSQHDIPAFKAPSYDLFGGGSKIQYDIQKSISYKLPYGQKNTQYSNVGQQQQYYQPGTTLYSTLNNQGQIGGLSSHLPQQLSAHDPQVPVIILRVYPSQLTDPTATLHPNLPQSHPLAAAVNSIDVQALLNKYVKNLLIEQPKYTQQVQTSYPATAPQDQVHSYQPQVQTYYQQEPNYQSYHQQQNYEYNQPSYQDEQNYEYVQPPQYQETYSEHSSSLSSSSSAGDELLTHENYPKETHTRVIFRTDKNKAGLSPVSQEDYTQTKTIKIEVPPNTYSAVEVQTEPAQYGYSDQSQSTGQGYYYSNNPQEGPVMQSYFYTQPGVQSQQYQDQNSQQYLQPLSYRQEQIYDSSNDADGPTPRNYHAHQKRNQRSKKRTSTKSNLQGTTVKDITRLQPIKA